MKKMKKNNEAKNEHRKKTELTWKLRTVYEIDFSGLVVDYFVMIYSGRAVCVCVCVLVCMRAFQVT